MEEEKAIIVGIKSFHAKNKLGHGDLMGIPSYAYVQQKHLPGLMEWTTVL